jgi:hypothetical protein
MIDNIENCKNDALKVAELIDFSGFTLPTIPSPFTSELGLLAWNKILKQTTITALEDPSAPIVKGLYRLSGVDHLI